MKILENKIVELMNYCLKSASEKCAMNRFNYGILFNPKANQILCES
jgi:hypothetical protein